MRASQRTFGLLALLTLQSPSASAFAAISPRQNGSNDSTSLLPFQITQDSSTPDLRAAGIEAKRATFQYGPPVAGGPSYPVGPLALTKKNADLLAVQIDEAPQLVGATVDSTDAGLRSAEV